MITYTSIYLCNWLNATTKQARRQNSVTGGGLNNFWGRKFFFLKCESEDQIKRFSLQNLRKKTILAHELRGENQKKKENGLYREICKKRFLPTNSGVKTSILGVTGPEMHSSGTEIVTSCGAQSSLRGASSDLGGHGPETPPPFWLRARSSLERRHSIDKNLHERYTTVMQSYIDVGYAELVTNEGKGELEGESWYLPHHPVVNARKPDKQRVVHDCAANS